MMNKVSGKSVLLVDDQSSVRDTLSVLLKTYGWTVTVAEDGAGGLELFGTGKFDCVLTDYQMPRMKGDALARAVKQAKPDQRVVMLTGFGHELLVNGRLPSFLDGMLEKPFVVSELLALLDPPMVASP